MSSILCDEQWTGDAITLVPCLIGGTVWSTCPRYLSPCAPASPISWGSIHLVTYFVASDTYGEHGPWLTLAPCLLGGKRCSCFGVHPGQLVACGGYFPWSLIFLGEGVACVSVPQPSRETVDHGSSSHPVKASPKFWCHKCLATWPCLLVPSWESATEGQYYCGNQPTGETRALGCYLIGGNYPCVLEGKAEASNGRQWPEGRVPWLLISLGGSPSRSKGPGYSPSQESVAEVLSQLWQAM